MEKKETIKEFYERHPGMEFSRSINYPNEMGHVDVYPRGEVCHNLSSYHRRDFYKISLSIGGGTLHYADKSITIKGNALVFSNPNIPYSWEAAPVKQSGFFCLFSEDFINDTGRNESFKDSPLFRLGGEQVYPINDAQAKNINDLFQKMMTEIASDYIYKYDVLRNYINLIIHEALKLKPADTYFVNNASTRIAGLFMNMLERQFPIDSPDYALKLRTAADYSGQLSVHVNHLNHAVKETTGKTTTVHIADRVIKEAKTLLKHTDWNVADIGYSLGFEYPAYFNNFFKKRTGCNPKAYRI